MRTDQIEQIIRQANPIPDLSTLEPEVAALGIDDPWVESAEIRHLALETSRFTEAESRTRDWGTLMGAAAVVAILIGLVVFAQGRSPVAGQNLVTDRPESGNELAHAQAVETAEAFVNGVVAKDLSSAVGYLADDAELEWGPATSPDNLDGTFRWEEAFGLYYTYQSCEASDGQEPFEVLRVLSQQSAIADELGVDLDPATLVLRVDRALITEATMNYGNLQEALWDSLRHWVVQKHRDDIEVMFSPGPKGWPARTTEESIALWERYTEDYLADEPLSPAELCPEC